LSVDLNFGTAQTPLYQNISLRWKNFRGLMLEEKYGSGGISPSEERFSALYSPCQVLLDDTTFYFKYEREAKLISMKHLGASLAPT